MSVDSHILAMRTMFDGEAAGDMSAEFERQLGDDEFRALVHEGVLEAVRGSADRPDATIRTSPATLAAVLFHGLPVDDAVRSGDLEIDGDERVVTRLAGLFPLPELASA